MDFRFYLDAGTSYSSTIVQQGDTVTFPVTFPNPDSFAALFGVNYGINQGDIYALAETFEAQLISPSYFPSNGAVLDESSGTVYFYQVDFDGGNLSKSLDGFEFTDSAFSCNGGTLILFFFIDDTGIKCVDDENFVYSDVSGVGETFELNGDSFPVSAINSCYVGITLGGEAVFFYQTLGGSGVEVSYFTYNNGASAVVATDLPIFDNSGGYGWEFNYIGGIFYAYHYFPVYDVPESAANVLYASADGITWTLASSGVFGSNEARQELSMFNFGGADIYAGFGKNSALVDQTTLYTSAAAVIANGGQSGNQGVTGGGVNGAGGAVGFSRVSAAVNFGQSVDSLAYPAGVIANGNDFGIVLGL